MPSKRVVLITGASAGIGLHSAQLLVREGHQVFGTRLPGESASGLEFEAVELDVRSDDSVAACVEHVLQRAGRLDVLINNAGIGLVGPVAETSLAECREVFETNYFGTVRMIRAVLPTMRAQRHGLIVNVGSVAGHLAVPFEAHYCASKLALDSFSRALRHEVSPFGIKVVVVDPGYVRTRFHEVVGRGSECLDAYDGSRARAAHAYEKAAEAGSEARHIAPVIRGIVCSRSPRRRYWAGADARLWGRFRRLIPEAVVDLVMRSKFEPKE